MLCGGTGNANPADETIQQIVDQVRKKTKYMRIRI